MCIDDFFTRVWGFEFGWFVVRTIYVAYDPNNVFLVPVTNLRSLVLFVRLRRKK